MTTDQHYNIQYHNADKLDCCPTLDNTPKFEKWIYTSKKKLIEKAKGQHCFLIVGMTEEIKKYYLWSYFKIEGYTIAIDDDKYYDVSGTGFGLQPPILLNNLDNFTDFKKFCGNFGIGFQNIDKHIFCKTLISLIGNNFEEKVTEARKLTQKERLSKIKEHSETPSTSKRTIDTFNRNQYVKEKVHERANGKCEFCNQVAPFNKVSDGTPFLEVHHILSLSDGGKDTIENAIALCPNCHRGAHYGGYEIKRVKSDSH